MISLEQLEALCHRAAAGEHNLADVLLPIETALDDIRHWRQSGRRGETPAGSGRIVARTGRFHLPRHGSGRFAAAKSWPLPKWSVVRSSPSAV